jgi:hypothetical protein
VDFDFNKDQTAISANVNDFPTRNSVFEEFKFFSNCSDTFVGLTANQSANSSILTKFETSPE